MVRASTNPLRELLYMGVNWYETAESLDLLAHIIWAEAEGEGIAGQCAVASVIKNRVASPRWWGGTIREVILKPYQFEGIKRLGTTKPWIPDHFLTLAVLATLNQLVDKTNGATHFCRHDVNPDWRVKLEYKTRIGNHVFYREA
jgi:N-acetylmuramoyl-L-alanine amidase